MKKLLIALVLSLVFTTNALLLIDPDVVLAHPGRTASDGCHFCRTNCDSWGVAWDARHCHRGGGGSGIARSPTPRPSDNGEMGTLETVILIPVAALLIVGALSAPVWILVSLFKKLKGD